MRCLVIGEKTSQVKTFASALCGSVTSNKHSKYIYEYHGKWTNSKNIVHDFTFLPLAGHITNIETNKGFGWNECPPIKIVYDKKALKFINTRKYVTILNKLIKSADELWLALDPDSEGDNIALEVVNILSSSLKKNNIPIKRVWNSSLTKAEIIRSFEHTKQWSDLLAWAVQGRRIVDAWLGFAGTREITRAARKVARVKVISVGRVQLPTLYFIVNRDVAHESFVSQDRWRLTSILSELGNNDKTNFFNSSYEKGLFDDEMVANSIFAKLQPSKGTENAEIIDIKNEKKSRLPPPPLNTTAAISLLSRLMRISAKKGLDLMVHLYSKGLLSYPRTENSKFKDNFPHKKILSLLLGHQPFIPLIKKVRQNHQVVVNGKKKGVEEDHDPIHPTGELKGLNSLNSLQKRAWEILSRHYISLFMHDFTTAVVKVRISILSEIFSSEGISITDLGWKEAHDWDKRKDKFLPNLIKGQKLRIIDLKLDKKPTQPPKRLTDSNLLMAMESANIGTKSSRPDILQKLVDRNYIVRSGRSLISTDWGRALVASLSPIWPEIVSPAFTAHVENLMDKVGKGTEKYQFMLDSLRSEYINLHQKLISKLHEYQKLLQLLNLQEQTKKISQHNPKMLEILRGQMNLIPKTPEVLIQSED